MSVKLKIKVTKEILERSKMCGEIPELHNATNCAVALAVRDIFPLAHIWRTGISPFYYNKNGGLSRNRWQMIPLPLNASDYITTFDNTLSENRPNLPELEFEISISEEVINQINLDELKPLLTNHPTLELV